MLYDPLLPYARLNAVAAGEIATFRYFVRLDNLDGSMTWVGPAMSRG